MSLCFAPEGRSGRGLLAAVLALVSALAAAHGVRGSLAQWGYFQSKYGADRDSLERILARAERVHRVYPHHYLFCILAAEEAYHRAAVTESGVRAGRLAAAELWCDRGLGVNRHRSQLRCLKARLIAMADPDEGVRYWREFVEWQFWAPYNHLVAVELALKAGDFEAAMDALRWVKGSEYHGPAKALIEDAWAHERRLPRSSSGRRGRAE